MSTTITLNYAWSTKGFARYCDDSYRYMEELQHWCISLMPASQLDHAALESWMPGVQSERSGEPVQINNRLCFEQTGNIMHATSLLW